MNRIKQLRSEFGFTQQDLADRLDSSKSVIGLYESETRKPSIEVLMKLSEIFDCSIDYLLGKSDIRNPKNINVNINEIDIEFASGIKGLNEENKQIAKKLLEGLLAQQKDEDNKQD